MLLDFRKMLAAMLSFSFFFVQGAEAVPCPFGTVSFNVTTTDDVNNLADLLDCSGQGVFNITWYASLRTRQSIEVSNQKNVTINGSEFPTIRSGKYIKDDTGASIDLGRTANIFSVVNGSTLSLNKVVLEGGYSEEGGAVDVRSSSYLYVVNCGFTNNSAVNGGEAVFDQGYIGYTAVQ